MVSRVPIAAPAYDELRHATLSGEKGRRQKMAAIDLSVRPWINI
jgi:hypothetical protein